MASQAANAWLKSAWAALPSGNTPAQNIAALNAETVADPSGRMQDVAAGAVLLAWFETGAYSAVFALSQQALTGGASDPAILTARMFIAEIQQGGTFAMSQPAAAAKIQAAMSALQAASALAASDIAAALALAAIEIPAWQANGCTSSLSGHDLVLAGILTEDEARAGGVA